MSENHSCSVRIKRILRLGKNTRILTYSIMAINVRNNYGGNHFFANSKIKKYGGISVVLSRLVSIWSQRKTNTKSEIPFHSVVYGRL